MPNKFGYTCICLTNLQHKFTLPTFVHYFEWYTVGPHGNATIDITYENCSPPPQKKYVYI